MYKHNIDQSNFETYQISVPLCSTTYDQEIIHRIYHDMMTVRILEKEAYQNYQSHMRGFLHLSIGQESIYAAIKSLDMENKFLYIGSYRCHALAYISGSPVNLIVNELMGRYTGICKGKGGSMHLYNNKMFGGHGIVGAQVSLGVGLAFAVKYKKESKIVLCFLGDGAANQGQVYESYNLALLHNLPIIFIIENNKYGMWTSNMDVSITDDFYKRWREMRGVRIRSNSVIDIRCVFEELTSNFDGPIVVQVDTYRHCGHAMHDDENYRDDREKTKMLEVDCIDEIRNLIQIDEYMKIDGEIRNLVVNAFEQAKQEPLPDKSEMFTDIIK